MVTDKPSIAQHINNFFAIIGSKLASKIKSSHSPLLSPRVVTNFVFKRVDGECVLKQLKSINPAKATGFDTTEAVHGAYLPSTHFLD